MRHLPWITLSLAGLACLVQTSPALGAALEFNRAAIQEGDIWRLATAHLAHFGVNHLTWDAVALLILGAMSEREDRQVFCTVLAASALVIGAAVWAWQPRFSTYRGLSGLASALFGLVCARLVADGWRTRHRFSIVLGGLGSGMFSNSACLSALGW